MNKLIVSVLTTAALAAAGAAFAQGGDAESQAGSAWRGTPNYGPNSPYYSPNRRPGDPPPPTAAEIGTFPTPYSYGTDAWGRPLYGAAPAYPYGRDAAPAYPYERRDWRNQRDQRDHRSRRDRDGDGILNNVDRHPDDPSRW